MEFVGMNKPKLSPEAKAWILYDGGNSAFATTVIAAFFPIFFNDFWASGLEAEVKTAYLGWGLTISNLVLLFTSPFIGAITDVSRTTKVLFSGFACIAIICVAALYFIPAGSWLYALIFFGIANYCFAAGNTLYDKMLIQVSDESNIAKISSYGFAFGYLGGGSLFLLNAAMTIKPEFFGLNSVAEAVQWSFLSVSVWWILFLIPIMLRIKDQGETLPGNKLTLAFQKVLHTLKTVSSKKNVFIFLLAFFLYIDGVHTIMAMAADFALNLGLPSSDIIVALILVQFVAFPTTLLWSKVASNIGDKNTLLITILLYLIVVGYSAFLSSAMEFYILAAMVGAIQGGIQSISRSYYATLIPQQEAGEYFGFYNMFGRAGAFMGPAMVAIFVTMTNDTKSGLIPIAALFIMGGIILLKVKSPHESL
ncbi:MFS transporter [Gammaproteobacteria bacterium]|nr:MFS transporter [Gammaproteobacteria bacterium]MDA9978876.1 MFS transporter [Gammaproteobacteria bacterium]MDC3372430.1 MFS transporter [Gammaproteobacteria bacterium]